MAIRRTKYLVVKPLAGGGYGYYWQPSAALARAGWQKLNLGKSASAHDPDKFAAAEARNREVEQGQQEGAGVRQVRARVQRNSFATAIAGYREHIDARVAEDAKPRHERNPLVGKPMSKETRSNYFNKLDIILEWGTTQRAKARNPRAGDILVTSITSENVLRFRDGLMKPGPDGHVAHARAHSTLRVLRSFMAWCEGEKIIPRGSNPASNFQLDAPASRETVWNAGGGTADFDAFIAGAEHLGYPSVALGLEIGTWSAQRMSDILKLSASQWGRIQLNDQRLVDQLRGDDPDLKGFTVVQKKTKTPLMLPMIGALRTKIEAAIAANMKRAVPQLTVLICEDTGRPWTRWNFSKKVREVRDLLANPTPEALAKGIVPRPELQDLWFMDLRRTRVCDLHDRGIDPLGISMITGHSPKTVDQILATTYRPRNTRGAAVTLLAAHGPTPRRADGEQEKQA